ncbi:MAG: T9SS type A sorting domain-containing protein [bacterium]
MKRLVLLAVILILGLTMTFAQSTAWTDYKVIGTDSIQKLQLRGLHYLSNGVVWVSGADVASGGKQFALLSTDHGQTWARKDMFPSPGTSILTCGIIAKDANNAITALTTGQILRTTNGGAKWDTVTSYADPTVGYFDAIRYIGQDSIIALGDADAQGVYVGRSFDGGKTWTRSTNLPDSAKLDGYYASYTTYSNAIDVYNKHIWMTLYYGSVDPPAILKSTDAGNTWTLWKFSLPGTLSNDYYLRSISMKDENIGYGVIRQVTSSSTTANYLVKTTDGGRTWSDTLTIETGIAQVDKKVTSARAIRGTNTVIAAGWAGATSSTTASRLWISTDNGTTWKNMNAPVGALGSDLKNIWALSANQFFAVGYKNIVKYAVAVGVDDRSPNTPTDFTLLQNYPNPFNPVTNISFSIPTTSNVQLDVYNVLGKHVASLVNGMTTPGTHTVQFNAAGLSSGVYFYTLRAGNGISTRSLLLLK